MTASRSPLPGRFVWHDLVTNDAEGARRFYGALFGWTFGASQNSKEQYLHLESRGVMFGGIVTTELKRGIPPHWMPYVEVEDVDACAARAQRSGGKLAMPAMEIPGVGRFAVVGDPTGAYFSPFRASGPVEPESDAPPAEHTFCWDELLTSDSKAAAAFYGEVIGWKVLDVPMGAMGTYHLFKRGGKDAAGMMQMPHQAPAPSHWLAYVAVDDVDACARKIAELKGSVLVPPTDIPGIGRFAVARDPLGAAFAVYKRLTPAA